MAEHHHALPQQTHGNEAPFVIVKPRILEGNGRPGKDTLSITEVQLVVSQILEALRFIPGNLHADYYTYKYTYKKGDFTAVAQFIAICSVPILAVELRIRAPFSSRLRENRGPH